MPEEVGDFSGGSCHAQMTFETSSLLTVIAGVAGMLWAVYNFCMVRKIDLEVEHDLDDEDTLVEDMNTDDKRVLVELGYKISDVRVG